MNISFGTASIAEILWTFCSIPGLVVWLTNLGSARRDLSAVRRAGVINGRFQWAKFSVLLTSVFTIIEVVFLLVGITGMVAPSVSRTAQLTPTAYALTLGLIGSSAMITFVGIRWRQVSNYILSTSRAKSNVEPTDQTR